MTKTVQVEDLTQPVAETTVAEPVAEATTEAVTEVVAPVEEYSSRSHY